MSIEILLLTEHLFSPMIAVMGRRGLEKIRADVRPVLFKAAAEATAYQRAHAAEKGRAAVEELKRLGITFQPMAKTEREFVARKWKRKLWAAFAAQYPGTSRCSKPSWRPGMTRPALRAPSPPPVARSDRLHEPARRQALRQGVRKRRWGTSPVGPGCWLSSSTSRIRLAVDVLMVFASVIWRYFLHDTAELAEEIRARADGHAGVSGAATAVGRASCRHRQFPTPCSGELAPGK